MALCVQGHRQCATGCYSGNGEERGGCALCCVGWIWPKPHRCEMYGEPMVFFITDIVNLVCGVIVLGIAVLSAIGFNL